MANKTLRVHNVTDEKYISVLPVIQFNRESENNSSNSNNNNNNNGNNNVNKNDGFVKQRFQDGSEYSGYIKKGKFEGLGIYRFPNGDVYFGEFSNDLFNGVGVMFYTRYCDRYEGQWKNGKRQGHGIYYRGNNELYQGEFDSNFREGYGQYTFQNCDAYIGRYKLGQEDGKAIYVSGEKMQAGEWKKGVEKQYNDNRPDPTSGAYRKLYDKVGVAVKDANEQAALAVARASEAEKAVGA